MVRPYDAAAAIAGLERVAAAGVRMLKLHAHTQRFDVADPGVDALERLDLTSAEKEKIRRGNAARLFGR